MDGSVHFLDDIIANEVREMRSAIEKEGRAAKGGRTKAALLRDKSAQSRVVTRNAVAKEAKLPERKIRLAQEIKKAASVHFPDGW